MSEVSSFAWFTAWVNQHLSLCLAFVRGKTWRQLVEGLGLPGAPVGSLTFEDALSEGTPLVRVGESEAWAYAVEDMPTLGIRTELLAGLSSKGGEAFALSYTPTINTFMYAADGELVNGFDLTVPHIRYGSEQHRFEEQMALAGFADDAVPVPGEMGARFVELVFGITFTADLLERPLPALTVQ